MIPRPPRSPAIANHGPEVVVADEIGYHKDVPVVQAAARRGVRVVATAHGETVRDLLENPVMWPLLGDPDLDAGKRRVRPVFQSVLEVRGRGRFCLYPSLASALDALLAGDQPEGIRIPDEPSPTACAA